MFMAIAELYRRGKINAAGIYKAVADNVITAEQAKQITGASGDDTNETNA